MDTTRRSENGQPIGATTKAKAWVAAIGSLVTVLAGALADDVFSADDVTALILALVSAAATVYAVYRVPNRPA